MTLTQMLPQTKNNNTTESLQLISRKPMVQLLEQGNLRAAMNLLPSTIEQATKGTPIQMIEKVVGEMKIEAFIAFELTLLASMVNVDERLNLQSHQIPVIAQELIREFRAESLADFHVCFKRGAMGFYDEKLLRLDGAVITQWMRKYLEEKYVIIENRLRNEKDDSIYTVRKHDKQEENVINPERNVLSALEVVIHGKDPGVDVSKHLTEEELKEFKENKSRAVKIHDGTNAKENGFQRYKLESPPSASTEEYVKKHQERMRVLQEKSFRYRHPNASEEEVKQFLESI